MPHESEHRPIRSFVRREGRLTAGQQHALDTLWSQYGIDRPAGALDWHEMFGRSAPVTCEIGFGDGEALVAMAKAAPERDFLGIEVYRPGIGHALQLLHQKVLSNVRLMCADAAQVMREPIPDASLAAVVLLFPDPWPKKRHHKRRLVQSSFVEVLARKLEPGGRLHMATDWADYAEHMRAVLKTSPAFEGVTDPPGDLCERPVTKFERRGGRAGHDVWDLAYRRI